MFYFIKDNKLHRFPVPLRCPVKRDKEPISVDIPRNVEVCSNCMQVASTFHFRTVKREE